MLYFIKSQNYLKIGYSQDFETLIDRMTSYITHNPDFVLLSFTEYGTTKDEKALHKLLKGNDEMVEKAEKEFEENYNK